MDLCPRGQPWSKYIVQDCRVMHRKTCMVNKYIDKVYNGVHCDILMWILIIKIVIIKITKGVCVRKS